jgi:hypothetical protein
VTGAAIAWVRPEGRSLIHWALAAVEFKFAQQIAPDDELSPQADPKRRSGPNRTVISDRSPRLSVVTSKTATPIHEAPPATPVRFADDDVIELPEPGDGAGQRAEADIDSETAEPAPVYFGGPPVITFFSAKGGTGRTTLATEVAALLAGDLGRLFSAPTNVDLRADVVGFNLRDLSEELVPPSCLLLANWLWTALRRDRRPRHLLIDEVGLLLEHEPIRRFLIRLARRIRKYGGSLILVSQNPGDFFRNERRGRSGDQSQHSPARFAEAFRSHQVAEGVQPDREAGQLPGDGRTGRLSPRGWTKSCAGARDGPAVDG